MRNLPYNQSPQTKIVYNNDISLESLENNSFSNPEDIIQYMYEKNKKVVDSSFDTPYTSHILNSSFQRQEYTAKYYPASGNYYTPVEIRGEGSDREGMCGICSCYFKLKTSNYWYHMNFTHGITSKGDYYPSPITQNERGVDFVRCTVCTVKVRLNNKKSSNVLSPFYKHYHKMHRKNK